MRHEWGLQRLLRVRVQVTKALLSPAPLLARIRDAYMADMLVVSRKASAMALPDAPEELWPSVCRAESISWLRASVLSLLCDHRVHACALAWTTEPRRHPGTTAQSASTSAGRMGNA